MALRHWFHEDEIMEAFEAHWPRRLARNLFSAAALRREYLRGERDGWSAANEDDRIDEDEGCVLGAKCCCPHPYHSSSECYSAEWAEQYFASADER